MINYDLSEPWFDGSIPHFSFKLFIYFCFYFAVAFLKRFVPLLIFLILFTLVFVGSAGAGAEREVLTFVGVVAGISTIIFMFIAAETASDKARALVILKTTGVDIDSYYDNENDWIKNNINANDSYNTESNIVNPPKPVIAEHQVMEHILLYGPAGLGKSALAGVVAKEAEKYYGHGVELIKLSPSQIQTKKQLDDIILRVVDNPYCILFIDEIHGMKREIEESLYSAIQDGTYDITLSNTVDINEQFRIKMEYDDGVQTIQLPPFTCIGATTLIGEINKPLKDRFPITIELQPYTDKEMLASFEYNSIPQSFSEYIGQENAKEIIKRCFRAIESDQKPVFSDDAKKSIIKISFGIMRLKKVYSKMCGIFAKANGRSTVTNKDVDTLKKLYDIDDRGFGRPHRAVLRALIEKKQSVPDGKSYSMSSQSLASIAMVSKSDIDSIYTPILESAGYLEKDGRQMKRISEKGYNEFKHLLK